MCLSSKYRLVISGWEHAKLRAAVHCKFGSSPQELLPSKPNLSSSGWNIPSSWPRPSPSGMLICTESSQFHFPEPAHTGPWVGVNCPLSAEHPVRQTIVIQSVCICVCVCVSVFGVGCGALPELRESLFHPTTCRLPAGIADRSKTCTYVTSREGKKRQAA